MLICEGCQNKFKPKRKESKYCSRNCYRKSTKKHPICPQCGIEFEKTYSKQEACSVKCASVLKSKRMLKGIEVPCDWCKMEFHKSPSSIRNRNFCCPDHQHKFNKKDPNMSKGWHQSKEAIKKISLASKGRKMTKENLEKIKESNKNRVWTTDMKDKLRQSNLGRKYSRKVNLSKGSKGSKNAMWKGDNASYYALHIWVTQNKGRPNKCVDCGTTSDKREIEWSNIDHKYRRNLDDYVGRCVPCHRRYDIKNGYRVFGRLVV